MILLYLFAPIISFAVFLLVATAQWAVLVAVLVVVLMLSGREVM